MFQVIRKTFSASSLLENSNLNNNEIQKNNSFSYLDTAQQNRNSPLVDNNIYLWLEQKNQLNEEMYPTKFLTQDVLSN